MTAKAAAPAPRRQPVPVEILGGMQAAGDAAGFDKGKSELVKNLEFRDVGLYLREPFINDHTPVTPNVDAYGGLMIYEDLNSVDFPAVLMWVGGHNELWLKNVSTGIWTRMVTSFPGTEHFRPVMSFLNYRGKLLFTTGDGVGIPKEFWSYNGGSSVVAEPVNPGIVTRGIVGFNDRGFLMGENLTISNVVPPAKVYDMSGWTLTTATAQTLTVAVGSLSQVTSRVAPTAAVGSKFEFAWMTLTPSQGTVHAQWLAMCRGVDATYRMPMTLEIFISGPLWQASHAYLKGQLVIPATPNGYRYSAVANGSSAGSAPTWPTTAGATVVDGGVTWTCDGPDAVISQPIEVPSRSDSTKASSIYVGYVSAPVVADTNFGLRYRFGTTDVPSVTLVPVDFGFKDGRPDGDPDKANFGQQLTTSDFRYPFCNTETVNVSSGLLVGSLYLRDYVGWTAVGDTSAIDAANWWHLVEEAGEIRGGLSVGGRLLVGMRTATWSFQGADDPNIPISLEKVIHGAGIVGPKACDRHADKNGDMAFVIAEDEIYSINTTRASALSPIVAEPICGPEMRRTIMDHGANWLENITAPAGGTFTPILRVHKRKRQVWVATQAGIIFVYDIDGGRWSQFNIALMTGTNSGLPVGLVRDMLYVASTGNMFVIVEDYPNLITGAGMNSCLLQTRTMSDTVTSSVLSGNAWAFDSDNAGVTYPLTAELWLPVVEARPQRRVMTVEDVGLYNQITQRRNTGFTPPGPIYSTSSTVRIDYSFDRGETWLSTSTYHPILKKKIRRFPIPIRRSGESVSLRIVYTGPAGGSCFNLFSLDMMVIDRGPETPKVRPTAV